MTKKKIFILLGHSDNRGMCGAMADAYESGARVAGHDVRRTNIADMKFDPILHHGYREIQQCEPDLITFGEDVKWSDHFVVIFPVWWLGMPAILKGLFDRVWLPGSAFRYMKRKDGTRSMRWQRLYKGKTARILMTSGSSTLLERLMPGNVNAQLRWGILWFAGFKVRTDWFGNAENVPEKRKQKILKRAQSLGGKGI